MYLLRRVSIKESRNSVASNMAIESFGIFSLNSINSSKLAVNSERVLLDASSELAIRYTHSPSSSAMSGNCNTQPICENRRLIPQQHIPRQPREVIRRSSRVSRREEIIELFVLAQLHFHQHELQGIVQGRVCEFIHMVDVILCQDIPIHI